MELSLPLKKIKHNRWFWFFVFGCVFVLSLDLWNWNKTELFFLGFPFWIIQVMLLTIILSPLFFLFVKFVWREN